VPWPWLFVLAVAICAWPWLFVPFGKTYKKIGPVVSFFCVETVFMLFNTSSFILKGPSLRYLASGFLQKSDVYGLVT
jgi:hypothetical protein